MQLSFVTSQNLLLFRFCKTSKKQHFCFSVVFPWKTAWRILTILVSFCRILNGLLDEINLFWRCSSPLKMGTSPSRYIQYPPLNWQCNNFPSIAEKLNSVGDLSRIPVCIPESVVSSRYENRMTLFLERLPF